MRSTTGHKLVAQRTGSHEDLERRSPATAEDRAVLTHQLGRSPRVKEVAAHLGGREDDIVEALSADGCYSPMSLDTPVGAEASGVLGDLLPDEDSAMSEAEARIMLAPAVRALPE